MAATAYHAAQSALLKATALACLLANYGRLKVWNEVDYLVQADLTVLRIADQTEPACWREGA